MKKEFIYKLLKKQYSLMNYNSIDILELVYHDLNYNEQQTFNAEVLSSIITVGNAYLWMYNEYRERNVYNAYDKNEFIECKDNINKFLGTELKKQEKILNSKNNYEIENAKYKIEEIEGIKTRFNEIFFYFLTIGDTEQSENKVIKDSRGITKYCNLKEMENENI